METRITGTTVLILFFLLLLPCATDSLNASHTRPSAVAGQFYPGTQTSLTRTVGELLDAVPLEPEEGKVAALIAPHAGYFYSGQTAAFGYRSLKEQPIRTVIVMGPSHHAGYPGLSIPEVQSYETPLGQVPLDQEICHALREHPGITSHPAAHVREHSIEVQLPFLQTLFRDFKIVPILVGTLREEDYPTLARAIQTHVDDTTLIVVSSDFTHYGPRYSYLPFDEDVQEQLSELDHQAFESILQVDRPAFLQFQHQTGDTICGFRPVALLLEILSGMGLPGGRLVDYQTSGAIMGDFSNSVSYASILFYRRDPHMYLTPDEKTTLLRLARETLKTYLQEQKELKSPPEGFELTERLREPAGAFVTLEKERQLRGCIGYIDPIRPLYRSVMENAVSACSRDYRFTPVKAAELDQIEIEISVLTPKREIPGPEAFIPGEHGIIIEKGGKRAVFLPHVAAEQGWDRKQTLQHLCRKAGLSLDAWKKGAQFWVFGAEVFSEDQGG